MKNDASKNFLPTSEPEDQIIVFSRGSFKESFNERLGRRGNQVAVKPSVKERLGKRKDNDLESDVENKHSDAIINRTSQEVSIKNRLDMKRENMKKRLKPKENLFKSRITSNEEAEQRPMQEAGMIIKSLAEIRAEKERLKQTNPIKSAQKDPELLPLSAFINNKKDSCKETIPGVENIKIKTLAEIKAEKNKSLSLNTSNAKTKTLKRDISPVSFVGTNKKVKTETTQNHKRAEAETKKPVVSFNSRKLVFKKPEGATSNRENKNTNLQTLESKSNSHFTTRLKSNTTDSSQLNTSENTQQKNQLDESKETAEGAPSTLQTNDSNSSKTDEQGSKAISRNLSAIRTNSFIDEEELLLQDDVNFDDEDIDEDELLL